ncbi:MAG TPA: hypothetical protein VHF69_05485 [Candidatus Synoicihabitans sp.]|nr:hypothetical protein [Candidatus Synoicihabitans sp.]
MTFAIKMLHEHRGRSIRKVDGYSGKLYVFRWNPDHRAYVYQPESQVEADDIFRTQGRTTSTYFAPCAPLTEPASVQVCSDGEAKNVAVSALTEHFKDELEKANTRIETLQAELAAARALPPQPKPKGRAATAVPPS